MVQLCSFQLRCYRILCFLQDFMQALILNKMMYLHVYLNLKKQCQVPKFVNHLNAKRD